MPSGKARVGALGSSAPALPGASLCGLSAPVTMVRPARQWPRAPLDRAVLPPAIGVWSISVLSASTIVRCAMGYQRPVEGGAGGGPGPATMPDAAGASAGTIAQRMGGKGGRHARGRDQPGRPSLSPSRRWWGTGLLLAMLAGVLVAMQHRSLDPVVHTTPVGNRPCCVAMDPHTGHVFVVNSGDNTVTMLDAGSGAPLHTTGVGNAPSALVVHQRTGHLFIVNAGDGTVSMLDMQSARVMRTVPVTYGVALAVDERRDHVFVVGGGNPGTVTTLDARSGRVVRTVTVGNKSEAVAVATQAGRVFVPNVWDGSVSVLDAASGRVVRTIGVGGGPADVAVDEHRGRAFVTNTDDHTVNVIDTRRGRVLRTVAVGAAPASLAVAASTGRVFVLNEGASTVSVLDSGASRVLRTVAVAGPHHASYQNAAAVAVDERDGRAYVIHEGAATLSTMAPGRVTVLDATRGMVLRTLVVGRVPTAMTLDAATGRLFVVNTQAGCLERPSVWALVPQGVRHWLPFLPRSPRPNCAMHGSVSVIDTSRV